MDKNRLAILRLIKAGLLSEKCVLEDNVDWNYIHVACYRQGIINLAYQVIKDNKLNVPSEYLRMFQVEALGGIRTDCSQVRLMEQLFRSFDELKITYLPLKGSVFKYLYPKTEFRQMGDADIYIKKGDYDRIKPLMEELGYTFSVETYHELTWEKKEEITVELHKTIVNPRYGMVGFFTDMLNEALSRTPSGCRADFNVTEHLIYAVTHLAKHFLIGMPNIRNLLDCYILRKDPAVDEAYLKKSLENIHLDEFYSVLCKALDEWFEDKPFSDTSEQLLDRILTVSKETTETRVLTSQVLREQDEQQKLSLGKRIGHVLKRFFLPYERMAQTFPVLRKVPVLLPVFWIWRPIYKLFKDPKHMKRFVDVSMTDPNSRVDQFRKELGCLGLEKMIADYDRSYK